MLLVNVFNVHELIYTKFDYKGSCILHLDILLDLSSTGLILILTGFIFLSSICTKIRKKNRDLIDFSL